MTSTRPVLTLNGPADIPVAVAAVLGFVPSNSMVVVAMAGGPTARVDLGPQTIDAFSVAVGYWSQVLLAIYSDDQADAVLYGQQFRDAYPDINVIVVTHVDPSGAVDGAHQASTVEVPDHIRIAPGRESLQAEAAEVDDADAALATAYDAFFGGDGARAWIFLDRSRELGLNMSAQDRLEYYLSQGVNPRTVDRDAV